MKETLRYLFQQKFNRDEYRRVVLQNLLHAQKLLREPQFLEETNEGDRIYGLGYLHDADGKEIGLYYTDVVNGDVRRKRVGFRQMMKPYVKYGADAAIAVFADREHWRLSYMCDLKGGETSAKRFSYVFGDPKGQYNTPSSRLADLGGKKIVLDDLKETFSVEVLSDEFFYNYRALYSKILGEGERGKSKYNRYNELSVIPEDELGFCDFLERHKDDTLYFGEEFNKWEEKVRRDYIKKLMGRLVFLQFLQKKGWMRGDVNYIKTLFERHVQANGERVSDTSPGSFLDCVLEPLFFGVLNTKVEDRKELFYKRCWNLKLLDEWKDIPYLNGGLFEQEEFDKPKSAFPNMLFNELLTLFSEYNFTIDENDPNDAEIGIDPEMLGKIFESQLEDNKDKGAFYTPKEIVQYMCQESLIAYLQTGVENEEAKEAIRSFVTFYEVSDKLTTDIEQRLREVKICDPAIGSGAFPMGLLNLLVTLREKLGETTSRYELKKEIIQNNIFGVDIEKGAVDIARLRFWLSIVIDEESNNPHALPNLDYQIVQGNSLLHRFALDAPFKDIFSDYNKQHGTKFKLDDYKVWVKEYLNTTDHEKKETFRKRIEEVKSCLRTELSKKEYNKEIKLKEKINLLETATLFGIDREQRKRINELKKQLKDLQEKHQEIINNVAYKDAFEWRFEFPLLLDDKGDFTGFDIVIGNPPYFNIQTLGANSSYVRAIMDIYSDIWQDKSDILFYFFKLALNLSRNVVCYITSNAYLFSDKAKKLRNSMIADGRLRKIVNFEDFMIFKNARITTCITLFDNKTEFYAVNLPGKDYSLNNVINYIQNKENFYKVKLKTDTVFALVKNNIDVLNLKIDGNHKQLRTLYKIGKGMETAANNIFCFLNYPTQFPPSFIKRRMCGEIIKRYHICQNDSFILYLEDVEKYEELPQPIKDYLSLKEEELKSRAQIKRSKTSVWWKYTFAMHKEYYHLNKIWCSYRAKTNEFALDESTDYIGLTNTTVIFDTNDILSLKYLLALLNSKVLTFRYKSIGKQTGGGVYEYFENGVGNLPIPDASTTQQKPIISLVDQIHSAKKANSQANTNSLERKIDILVYLLYNLDWNDVKIIEGSDENISTLPCDEAMYNRWQKQYQTDGTLPTEDDMK